MYCIYFWYFKESPKKTNWKERGDDIKQMDPGWISSPGLSAFVECPTKTILLRDKKKKYTVYLHPSINPSVFFWQRYQFLPGHFLQLRGAPRQANKTLVPTVCPGPAPLPGGICQKTTSHRVNKRGPLNVGEKWESCCILLWNRVLLYFLCRSHMTLWLFMIIITWK